MYINKYINLDKSLDTITHPEGSDIYIQYNIIAILLPFWLINGHDCLLTAYQNSLMVVFIIKVTNCDFTCRLLRCRFVLVFILKETLSLGKSRDALSAKCCLQHPSQQLPGLHSSLPVSIHSWLLSSPYSCRPWHNSAYNETTLHTWKNKPMVSV